MTETRVDPDKFLENMASIKSWCDRQISRCQFGLLNIFNPSISDLIPFIQKQFPNNRTILGRTIEKQDRTVIDHILRKARLEGDVVILDGKCLVKDIADLIEKHAEHILVIQVINERVEKKP